MKSKLFSLISLLFVSGCAGTPTHVRMLEAGGAVRSEPSTEPGYDFKVWIQNTRDFGWDGGNREDRQKTVNAKFEENCKSTQIVEESSIPNGTYALGKPAMTWVMKVKCLN